MNKTTIEYNETETELTLLVNEKPLHKYAFVKYENEQGRCPHPCNLCDFKGMNCEVIKCMWDKRKDASDGYYKLLKNGN